MPEQTLLEKRSRRVARHALFGLFGLVILLIGTGALYNALAIHHYRQAYPPPGKFYTVNGKRMHLYCTGQGSPTIVLESGFGDDWLVWAKVQPSLSKITQVCSYDRAGLGWSEDPKGAHDANSIADRLHALLLQAEIREPVVLMGHSIAGLYIRAYTARYPHEVAGLIFVDGSTPLQMQRFPGEFQTSETSQSRWWTVIAARWQIALGLKRIEGQCVEIPPGLEAYGGWLKADSCMPSQFDTTTAETHATDQSGQETIATGPFGDLPILIVSEDPAIQASLPIESISVAAKKQWADTWNQMQEDFKHLSTRSRRIIAKGSSHYVEIHRADLLNREVPIFIQQIRSNTTAPDNGSTKLE